MIFVKYQLFLKINKNFIQIFKNKFLLEFLFIFLNKSQSLLEINL